VDEQHRVTSRIAKLPPFNVDGLLPPGDYPITLDELKGSMLVEGYGKKYPSWDVGWRMRLVENLGVLATQLWQVGITEIFVDGSFVEDKAHPNDIDGYFECDVLDFASGRLQKELNKLDPYEIWTWAPETRRPYRNYPKRQLPMWHRYRVELYPHYPGLTSGIRDHFGNELTFPAAFRISSEGFKPKGIIKLMRSSEEVKR
jgi:hypothetical protein